MNTPKSFNSIRCIWSMTSTAWSPRCARFTRDRKRLSVNEYTLQREGCPLHYWLGGDEKRPLIVLTHGATGDHRQFDAQLHILTDKYRVLTWDMRGHGKSQPIGADFTVPRAVDDLLAILDTIGIQQAVFIGQSTGGYVIQE